MAAAAGGRLCDGTALWRVAGRKVGREGSLEKIDRWKGDIDMFAGGR